ncbi:MAG: SPFH domain-containing protein [Polyangiales bacterium]
MSPNAQLFLGLVLGAGLVPLLAALFRAVTVEVEDEEAVLVTSFGRLVARLTRPGLHWFPARAMPWVTTHVVSLRKDFRDFKDVHVNDARGTTVMIDLWLEFRITDPVKALFEVSDWDRLLQNLVAHAATSILCNREFKQILCDRSELSAILRDEIRDETARWGITVERVYIRNVMLLPEVSRQIFETVAARLERARADIEEAGRLAVAKLEADTSVRVAALVAEAKGQYPKAIGEALGRLRSDPAVLAAYAALYELSLVRPHRTVVFRGFGSEAVRAVDAAMLAPVGEAASPAGVHPLPAADHRAARGTP